MRSILVIGCGSIGERQLRCFQATGRARLTACESQPALLETVTRTYGVAGHRDWERALGDHAFDAVVIATPAHLHVPMAIRALARGCHVLIEKPLSQSLAGVDDLLQARDRAGRHAAVAYVLHTHPLLAPARDFLRGGDLGPVLQVTTTSGQHFPAMRPAHAAPYHQTYYRDRRTGGGAIQDALTHTVNWVESIVGPADSVLCDCAHLAVPLVDVEDTVHASARHGAVLASYSLNQFQAPNEAAIQFNTATGSVRVELHARRWASTGSVPPAGPGTRSRPSSATRPTSPKPTRSSTCSTAGPPRSAPSRPAATPCASTSPPSPPPNAAPGSRAGTCPPEPRSRA
jgi:predicted dehydrogenase